MSTISRERVAGIASGEKCYTHDDVVELARIALASLEAEAVAWTDEQELRDVEKFGCAYLFTVNPITPNADPRRVIKLYSAPPAPANAEPVAWLWSHRKHPSEVSIVRPEDDERAEGAHWSGWSCQALYAEPQQEVK